MSDLAQSAWSSPNFTYRLLVKAIGRRIAKALPRPVVQWIQRIRGRPYRIPIGLVRFGDLKRSSPIGHGFGFDRGRPIDRYYIEKFLAQNAADIRGRVLEIEDNSYTLRFGGIGVTRSDILHVDRTNPRATFVGDLTRPETLPADVFDCIVLTQTLHLVYDMQAAVKTLYDALKPGGVLLVTVPGITPIDSGEWKSTWYWSLTAAAAQRLLGTVFDTESLTVNTYGNVFAATAFLYALATEELGTADLDVNDLKLSHHRFGSRDQTNWLMSFRGKLKIRSRLRSIVHRIVPPAPRPLILMYHRIASEPNDPWGLSVSSENFEQQLQVLRRTRRPFPLADFVRNLMAGALPPNAVALTFDDGYVDNLEAAKPLLAAADVPATVFVATGYLDRPEEFWWDELSRLVLSGRGPHSFELSIGGQAVHVDRGADIIEREDRRQVGGRVDG